jgi:hypothetical protein
MAPVATVTGGPERGQFHDLVHEAEQFAIMADHQRALAPAGEHLAERFSAVAVEIIGGFVQQQEIGIRKKERGKAGPCALAARKRVERRLRHGFQPHPGEGSFHARLERPVDIGQFPDRCLACACGPHQGQLGAHAEQVGDGGRRINLNGLVEHGHRAADGHGAGLRFQPAGNEMEKSAFADAVAADQSCAAEAEGKVDA